ncbi:MAG: amino acid adenylation domain-containing protein [Acidobacteriota bacterium]|nr:amino acid adenylation domain-containing protein [Acidobacteriota bacterium]
MRLGHRDHALVLVVHHIVSDGWSQGILFEELGQLYGALTDALTGALPGAYNGPGDPAGEPILPPLPVQYADYVLWQRRRLEGDRRSRQLEFWRRRLEPVPWTLELPTDRPRPAVESHRGAALPVRLPAALVPRLERLARDHDGTLFMVLLAAFGALLSRLAGQDALLVGTPVAGRPRPELEGIVGLFANTLALPVNLASEAEAELTGAALLARMRAAVLAAFEHQEFPFEGLVAELNPERTRDRHPLFQVMLTLQNLPPRHQSAGDLELEALEAATGATRVDLTLELTQQDSEVFGVLEYAADLFDATTVNRWWGHLERLLGELCRHPGAPLAELEVLSPTQRRQLLGEWGDGGLETRLETQLVPWLWRRLSDEAHGAGVTGPDGELWSGPDLLRRAEVLAARLVNLGAGPERGVGLFLHRSPALVPALLGVLRSGSYYVPLDPAFPPERLRFMAQDAGLAVLLVDGEGDDAAVLDLPAEVPRLVLDPQGGCTSTDASGAPGELPPLENLDGASLAYVLYTSGSTGRPKGVEVPRGALAAFLAAMAQEPGLESSDVLVAVTTLSFDIAGLELFLPLVCGSRLVVASRRQGATGEALAELLEESGATALQATPATWRLLLEVEGWTLRKILSGGEALPRDLAAALAARLSKGLKTGLERSSPAEGSGPGLWNLYGPTETTVWSARRRLASNPSNLDQTVTVGGPIEGTRLYVLDRGFRPVLPGAPGELFVGGAGVTRGYRSRPARTAGAFVPDPLGEEPGGRLYRTGDRVRWRADGRLEFHGRWDAQVKVRGYRIELGEVEAALEAHRSVAQAAVKVVDGADAGARLAAFLVPADSEETLEEAALRRDLGERLPAYMVPSSFTVLEELPLTANRKVDRRRLPEPGGAGLARAPHLPPRTPDEEAVAAIWSQVLDRDEVGALDDFFLLGGHSLLATRVVARLRESLGVELPVATLFDASTVEALALRVAEARDEAREGGGAGGEEEVPLTVVPAEERRRLPLSFSQLRQWFLDQLEPGTPAYNLPTAVALVGDLDEAALERALQALVQRHEILRTRFVAASPEPVQVVEEDFELPLHRFDLRPLPPAEREEAFRQRAEEESAHSFRLDELPLLRAALVRMEEQEWRLLLTVHHMVTDGWSFGILLREVAELYGAIVEAQNPAAALPPLPLQYGDYASWQRRRLQGERLEAELDFWRRSLADGGSPPLALPTDHPRPAMQSFRGDQIPFVVEGPLRRRLEELARRHAGSLHMVLTATLEALFYRYTGQTDLTVGTFVAGRTRPELEGLIGFFVNTLALRTRFAPDAPFEELLTGVRSTTLGAYNHQQIPFEKLLEEVQPERDMSRTPLFQVMLVLQNVPVSKSLEVPGVELRTAEAGHLGRANFDLTFWIFETVDGLRGQLEYNRDLFEPASVERFLAHYQALLTAVAEEPGARLSRLPLVAEAERRQLLEEWNRPLVPREPEAASGTVVEAWFRRVQEAPSLPALREGSRRLTYGELATAVQRLAARLADAGAGPETVVALSFPRGVEQMVAVLATLAVGAAYAPLDPALPPRRLEAMVEDSGARLLLIGAAQEPPLAADFLEERGLAVLAVGDEDSREVPMERDWRPVAPDPQSLAYIIFTSGSTGRPKPVGISHGALANHTADAVATYGVGAQDRLLQFASLSFDASAEEIYPALTTGAELVLRDEEMLATPGDFLAACGRLGITVLNLPTAYWHALTADGGTLPECVTRVIIGGEKARVDALEAWQERHGESSALYNTYGPTEATVVAARWQADGDTDLAAEVPIGRPLGGCRLYVLDRDGEPLPVGVPGELYIAGAGLARGYLGRPGDTARVFLPDPFGAAAGARLYRTGDLGRWRHDGLLECLGRQDHQVKVRGYRIELGEIEACLRAETAVAEAVVDVRRTADSSPEAASARLVAWVVPAPEASQETTQLDADALREALRQQLPEYMLPAVFVPLDEMPLTTAGKVDRRALPDPDPAARTTGREFVAPETPSEQTLAAMVEELLGVEGVGIYDSFFDLGGHSMLATQYLSRIRDAFEVELPLRTLFEAPTVASLAVSVEEAILAELEALEALLEDEEDDEGMQG